MKILVVSNLYPPFHIGGYELGCRDVVEKLRTRGHDVQVLTGDFRRDEIRTLPPEPHVARDLHYSLDSPQRDLVEGRKLADAIRRHRPDLVYFWNIGGLSAWLPLAARWVRCPMAFFLSDTNFVSWRIGAWMSALARRHGLVRRLLGTTWLVRGWPVIRNQCCHFASEFLRRCAMEAELHPSSRSIVAHWGIDAARFVSPHPTTRWPITRLLYVGQMIPQKGVHTALEAFALLAREEKFRDWTFSLAGSGHDPDYDKRLRELVDHLKLQGRVHFLGRISRDELCRTYAGNDVLLFPSEWPEPFAITPLEAMAAGLVVVGTTTGGSGELFRDRRTAMTFHAGDPADCARAVRELCRDRELFDHVRDAGRREILENHTLDAMADSIERSLLHLTAERRA